MVLISTLMSVAMPFSEVLNHGTHEEALPAWHAKTPPLGACNQY